MRLLEEIMKDNEVFLAKASMDYSQEDRSKGKVPQRHLLIITCMDTRLVNFLEPALGIQRGDAKIIKIAGNSLSGPFDTIIRSLLIAIFKLEVQEIMVIGHQECGMAGLSAEGLMADMLCRGISSEAIQMVAAELRHWAQSFRDEEQNVRDTVRKIRQNPLIPKDVPVHGLIFHPRRGKADVLVNGYGEMRNRMNSLHCMEMREVKELN